MAVAPGAALAQEYRFAGFDAPRGASATLNLRVPLGTERQRPTAGLTLGVGQTVPLTDMTGRTRTRSMNLADFRFTENGLRNARVASFDLANLDRDRRLQLMGGGNPILWIVIGAAAAAATYCFVIEDNCLDEETDFPT